MFQLFKNFLAPKKCYGCKKIGTFFCLDCQKKCEFFSPICYVCKKPSENFSVHAHCKSEDIFYDAIFPTGHYHHKIIKKLLKDAKFYHKKDILEDLTEIMYFHHKQFFQSEKENMVFIATPMFFFKKIFRWYNQSELMVWHFSKKFWFCQNFHIIKKIKSTKSQSTLSKIERIDNLKDCYKVDKNMLKLLKNKTIVIVDDVVSTGSTINEIAKILKQNGIQKVYGLVFSSD